MKQLDIGVAGAGPAGLAAALFLSRAGHRVEILERFDTPAPVGSGLLMQPTGLTVLAALGLFDTIQTLGNRIDRLHGADAVSGRTVLDVRYDAAPGGRYGLAVQRAALFDTLHDALPTAFLFAPGSILSQPRLACRSRRVERSGVPGCWRLRSGHRCERCALDAGGGFRSRAEHSRPGLWRLLGDAGWRGCRL